MRRCLAVQNIPDRCSLRIACRKRRIKCGEERPICKNCTKSKRNCEGYNQRMVFKQTAGGLHLAGQESNLTEPIPLAPSLPPGYQPSYHFTAIPGSNFPLHPIAPRPMYIPPYNPATQVLQHYGAVEATSQLGSGTPFVSRLDDNSSARTHIWNTQINQNHSYEQAGREPAYNFQQFSGPIPSFHPGGQFAGQTYPSGQILERGVPGQTYSVDGFNPNQGPESQHVDYENVIRYSRVPQAPYGMQYPQSAPPSLPRDQSSSSDDWQNITPPLASALNGKPLSGDHASYMEVQARIETLKHEAIVSGPSCLAVR